MEDDINMLWIAKHNGKTRFCCLNLFSIMLIEVSFPGCTGFQEELENTDGTDPIVSSSKC